MRRARAPGAVQEQARRVARHLLASGDLRVMSMVVALLVEIGWFTDSLFEWLTDFGVWFRGGKIESWWPLHRLIAVGVFLAELLALYMLARDARKRYRPRVGIEQAPAPVHGLILFLSNLPEAKALDLKANLIDSEGMDGFRERFGQLNWRMPLEAIAYHLPRLQQVVVICSRTEQRANGRELGSAA